MMHYYGFGHGFMGIGWLFQLGILLLFFWVVWWMLKNGRSFGYKCKDNETALDILKKRLASGEIDDREYHRLKKEIEK